MDQVWLSLAEVFLGSSFGTPRRKLTIVLVIVGMALLLYVTVQTLRRDQPTPAVYELTSDSDGSGHWFKLKPEEESGERPFECACTVTSFSGEFQWRLREQALMQREGVWGPGEIIMRWTDDFAGPQGRPAPGTYEIECSALVTAEDGSVVQIEPIRLKFDHE